MRFRQNYNEYDIEAGCIHANLEVQDVIFIENQEDLDPLDLLSSLGDVDLSPLKKYKYGWAQDKDTEDFLKVLEEMNGTTRGYWDELLQCPLYPPVIIIDGKLCDGAHRCILAYLQGENVVGAKFMKVLND